MDSARETAFRGLAYNQAGADLAITIGLRVYPNTPFQRMVTFSRFEQHYQPCSAVPWLGVFCSPTDRKELAETIVAILPPSKTVNYTNTVNQDELNFYTTMSRVAERIHSRHWSEASKLLQALPLSQAERPEVELAKIKVSSRTACLGDV